MSKSLIDSVVVVNGEHYVSCEAIKLLEDAIGSSFVLTNTQVDQRSKMLCVGIDSMLTRVRKLEDLLFQENALEQKLELSKFVV